MSAALDWHLAKALLEWQVELGVTEAICDAPIDRFAEADETARPAPAAPPAPAVPASSGLDPAAEAARLAGAAPDLQALSEGLAGFAHCELRKGARNCVFADGNPAARVMIIGEGPGREEDQRGLPFVGQAGRLLDKMFAAIGLARTSPAAESALYITNTVPWRPPANREPTPDELAMLLPFLERHVDLAAPDLLVLMGNVACQALLGRRGILKLRGKWQTVLGRPALPMLHPAYLLRNAEAKRETWADLLSLQARLRELP
ncbi:MAG: DNA polymerase bacteriophage-type [Rhodobacteraceae bacterium HLUCCA12]|nr:MAG: DNA polymerase bacteriophage-type [Rhodobacteraceae bacterium HLUCCA12]